MKRCQMELEFARLQDYENCWPIRCIIKSKLKSSSEISRRQGGAGKSLRSRVSHVVVHDATASNHSLEAVRENHLAAPDQ